MVIRRATLIVGSAAVLGSGLGAQRGVLPFGLKSGHHAVRVQTVSGLTSWTPEDSGTFPAVVISADGPTALDSVLPRYLASHGFRVARVQKNGIEAAMGTLGDATPVAVVQWGRDSAAAALLDGTQPLSIRVVHPGTAPSGRLRIALPPPGARPDALARRYRLLCAVTQAILNATIASARPTLQELAARLRAAGLQGTYIRDS
jgi:hypothetical protein